MTNKLFVIQEIPESNVELMFNERWDSENRDRDGQAHGSKVLSKVIGKTLGIATRANTVVIDFGSSNDMIAEVTIYNFVMICERIFKYNQQGQAVINWSGHITERQFDDVLVESRLRKLSSYICIFFILERLLICCS